MKNLLLYLFPLTLAFQTHAQPDIEWSVSLGGSGAEYSGVVEPTSDGGYIVGAWTYSNDGDVKGNHGITDIWLVKLGAMGGIMWQKTLGGSNEEVLSAVRVAPDGGYFIGGTTSSHDGDVSSWHGLQDYWVVKTNALGEIQWEKTYGGSDFDVMADMTLTADGGCFLIGYSLSFDGDVTGNYGNSDYWAVKIDSIGNLEWQRSMGGSSFDHGNAGIQTADGGYIVAGFTKSNDNDVSGLHGLNTDSWVVKLNHSGEIEWQRPFGGYSAESLSDILQTTDGGFLAAGITRSSTGEITSQHCQPNSNCTDYSVFKFGANGSLEWAKAYGGSLEDTAYKLQPTSDGGFIVAGSAESGDFDVAVNYGRIDIWVLKLSQTGDIEWGKVLGGSNEDVPSAIKQTADGGYIISGSTNSIDGQVTGNHGINDLWVVKLGASVGTQEAPETQPLGIYPNPARDLLFFKTSCAGAGAAVSDMLGRPCITRVISPENQLDIAQLPAGVYCISVQMPDGERISQKFIKK